MFTTGFTDRSATFRSVSIALAISKPIDGLVKRLEDDLYGEGLENRGEINCSHPSPPSPPPFADPLPLLLWTGGEFISVCCLLKLNCCKEKLKCKRWMAIGTVMLFLNVDWLHSSTQLAFVAQSIACMTSESKSSAGKSIQYLLVATF